MKPTTGREVAQRVASAAVETIGLAATLWRTSPLRTAIVIVLVAVATALTALATYLTGSLISSVSARAPWESVLPILMMMIAAMALAPVIESAVDAIGADLDTRLLRRQHRRLAESSLAPTGLSHLEDPELATRTANLVDGVRDWRSLEAARSSIAVLSARAAGVAAVVVIAAAWTWWVPVVLAVAEWWLGAVFRRYIAGVMLTFAPPPGSPRRRIAYLAGLLTGTAAARELRLFGLTGWVLDRWQGWWDRVLAEPELSRELRRSLVWSPLLLVAYLGAFALLVSDLSRGALSTGDVLVVLQGLAGLTVFGMLGDHQSSMVFAATTNRSLARLRTRLAPSGTRIADRRAVGATHPAVAAGCEFEDVDFTYPGTSTPVLRNFSLRIEAGQTVAVVGANGAGKSTLIRLLTGLQAPDAGRVLVDGRPADPATGIVSVIFQDFAHYPLSVRDNVALADPTPGDDERVRRVLAAAGAASLFDRYGPGTILSPAFEDGTDLSGGQWQRIALARAFASVERGASVLVLDEPTSALDIRAEGELFDRFAAQTADVTTILVTHRLSTVRAADRIVVIDQGLVAEDGTHDDLMAHGGRYAAMFSLQAARFARAGGSADDR